MVSRVKDRGAGKGVVYNVVTRFNLVGSADLAASALIIGRAFHYIGAGAMIVQRTIQSTLQSFSAYESGLISVSKVAGLTGAEMDRLGSKMEDLSVRLGRNTKVLFESATEAARLGFNTSQEIARITEIGVRLERTTDLRADEAVTRLARLTTLTGEHKRFIGVLGDVLSELGDNVAAKESEISHIANNMAKGMQAFGVGGADSLLMGAVAAEMDIQAESSATAMLRFMTSIKAGMLEGGDRLRTMQEVTGLSLIELQDMMQNNTFDVVKEMLRGLSKIPQEENIAQILDHFGISQQRGMKVFLPLIERFDRFQELEAIVEQTLEDPTKAFGKSERVMKGLSAERARTSASVERLKTDIGEELETTQKAFHRSIRHIIEEFRAGGEVKDLADGLKELLEPALGVVQLLIKNIDAIPAVVRKSFNLLTMLTGAYFMPRAIRGAMSPLGHGRLRFGLDKDEKLTFADAVPQQGMFGWKRAGTIRGQLAIQRRGEINEQIFEEYARLQLYGRDISRKLAVEKMGDTVRLRMKHFGIDDETMAQFDEMFEAGKWEALKSQKKFSAVGKKWQEWTDAQVGGVEALMDPRVNRLRSRFTGGFLSREFLEGDLDVGRVAFPTKGGFAGRLEYERAQLGGSHMTFREGPNAQIAIMRQREYIAENERQAIAKAKGDQEKIAAIRKQHQLNIDHETNVRWHGDRRDIENIKDLDRELEKITAKFEGSVTPAQLASREMTANLKEFVKGKEPLELAALAGGRHLDYARMTKPPDMMAAAFGPHVAGMAGSLLTRGVGKTMLWAAGRKAAAAAGGLGGRALGSVTGSILAGPVGTIGGGLLGGAAGAGVGEWAINWLTKSFRDVIDESQAETSAGVRRRLASEGSAELTDLLSLPESALIDRFSMYVPETLRESWVTREKTSLGDHLKEMIGKLQTGDLTELWTETGAPMVMRSAEEEYLAEALGHFDPSLVSRKIKELQGEIAYTRGLLDPAGYFAGQASPGLTKDVVEEVVNATTVRLRDAGLVTLEGVRAMPGAQYDWMKDMLQPGMEAFVTDLETRKVDPDEIGFGAAAEEVQYGKVMDAHKNLVNLFALRQGLGYTPDVEDDEIRKLYDEYEVMQSALLATVEGPEGGLELDTEDPLYPVHQMWQRMIPEYTAVQMKKSGQFPIAGRTGQMISMVQEFQAGIDALGPDATDEQLMEVADQYLQALKSRGTKLAAGDDTRIREMALAGKTIRQFEEQIELYEYIMSEFGWDFGDQGGGALRVDLIAPTEQLRQKYIPGYKREFDYSQEMKHIQELADIMAIQGHATLRKEDFDRLKLEVTRDYQKPAREAAYEIDPFFKWRDVEGEMARQVGGLPDIAELDKQRYLEIWDRTRELDAEKTFESFLSKAGGFEVAEEVVGRRLEQYSQLANNVRDAEAAIKAFAATPGLTIQEGQKLFPEILREMFEELVVSVKDAYQELGDLTDSYYDKYEKYLTDEEKIQKAHRDHAREVRNINEAYDEQLEAVTAAREKWESWKELPAHERQGEIAQFLRDSVPDEGSPILSDTAVGFANIWDTVRMGATGTSVVSPAEYVRGARLFEPGSIDLAAQQISEVIDAEVMTAGELADFRTKLESDRAKVLELAGRAFRDALEEMGEILVGFSDAVLAIYEEMFAEQNPMQHEINQWLEKKKLIDEDLATRKLSGRELFQAVQIIEWINSKINEVYDRYEGIIGPAADIIGRMDAEADPTGESLRAIDDDIAVLLEELNRGEWLASAQLSSESRQRLAEGVEQLTQERLDVYLSQWDLSEEAKGIIRDLEDEEDPLAQQRRAIENQMQVLQTDMDRIGNVYSDGFSKASQALEKLREKLKNLGTEMLDEEMNETYNRFISALGYGLRGAPFLTGRAARGVERALGETTNIRQFWEILKREDQGRFSRVATGVQLGATIGQVGQTVEPTSYAGVGGTVGGAVGALAGGPFGSAIGSVAGTLFGSMFKKGVDDGIAQILGDDTRITKDQGDLGLKAKQWGDEVRRTLDNILATFGEVGDISEAITVHLREGMTYVTVAGGERRGFKDPRDATAYALEEILKTFSDVLPENLIAALGKVDDLDELQRAVNVVKQLEDLGRRMDMSSLGFQLDESIRKMKLLTDQINELGGSAENAFRSMQKSVADAFRAFRGEMPDYMDQATKEAADLMRERDEAIGLAQKEIERVQGLGGGTRGTPADILDMPGWRQNFDRLSDVLDRTPAFADKDIPEPETYKEYLDFLNGVVESLSGLEDLSAEDIRQRVLEISGLESVLDSIADKGSTSAERLSISYEDQFERLDDFAAALPGMGDDIAAGREELQRQFEEDQDDLRQQLLGPIEGYGRGAYQQMLEEWADRSEELASFIEKFGDPDGTLGSALDAVPGIIADLAKGMRDDLMAPVDDWAKTDARKIREKWVDWRDEVQDAVRDGLLTPEQGSSAIRRGTEVFEEQLRELWEGTVESIMQSGLDQFDRIAVGFDKQREGLDDLWEQQLGSEAEGEILKAWAELNRQQMETYKELGESLLGGVDPAFQFHLSLVQLREDFGLLPALIENMDLPERFTNLSETWMQQGLSRSLGIVGDITSFLPGVDTTSLERLQRQMQVSQWQSQAQSLVDLGFLPEDIAALLTQLTDEGVKLSDDPAVKEATDTRLQRAREMYESMIDSIVPLVASLDDFQDRAFTIKRYLPGELTDEQYGDALNRVMEGFYKPFEESIRTLRFDEQFRTQVPLAEIQELGKEFDAALKDPKQLMDLPGMAQTYLSAFGRGFPIGTAAYEEEHARVLAELEKKEAELKELDTEEEVLAFLKDNGETQTDLLAEGLTVELEQLEQFQVFNSTLEALVSAMSNWLQNPTGIKLPDATKKIPGLPSGPGETPAGLPPAGGTPDLPPGGGGSPDDAVDRYAGKTFDLTGEGWGGKRWEVLIGGYKFYVRGGDRDRVAEMFRLHSGTYRAEDLAELMRVSLGRRQYGGPVDENTPYFVGEVGPELFVPDTSGRIVPNSAFGRGRPWWRDLESPTGLAQSAGSRSARQGLGPPIPTVPTQVPVEGVRGGDDRDVRKQIALLSEQNNLLRRIASGVAGNRDIR